MKTEAPPLIPATDANSINARVAQHQRHDILLNPEPMCTSCRKHLISMDGCKLKLGKGMTPSLLLWCCGARPHFLTATFISLDFTSISLLISAVCMCKQSVWKLIKPSSVIWIIKRKGKQTYKQSIRSQINQFYLILLPGSVEQELRQLSFNQIKKKSPWPGKMQMEKWFWRHDHLFWMYLREIHRRWHFTG